MGEQKISITDNVYLLEQFDELKIRKAFLSDKTKQQKIKDILCDINQYFEDCQYSNMFKNIKEN